MKKLTTALVFAFIASATTSNAQSFEKGTNVVAVGVGLGSSILNYSGSSQTPAISISFEHGTFEAGDNGVISLGGYIGTKSYKYSFKEDSYSYTDKWNYTIVGVRGAYHYTALENEKIDVYGGAMLSYNILKYKYKDNTGNSGNYSSAGSYGSSFGFTAFIGGRYYFTDNIAAMAELGYGVSYLTLGLAFKF
ncbi:MAG TPA: hypothetical protein VFI29_15560 [Hanamia sp.]|nr:hypothetical protein [Hanamia sp.]